GHGGLTVGRKAYPAFLGEALHPMKVVLQLGAIEHGSRQAYILAQQIPPRLAVKLGGTATLDHQGSLCESFGNIQRRIVINTHEQVPIKHKYGNIRLFQPSATTRTK